MQKSSTRTGFQSQKRMPNPPLQIQRGKTAAELLETEEDSQAVLEGINVSYFKARAVELLGSQASVLIFLCKSGRSTLFFRARNIPHRLTVDTGTLLSSFRSTLLRKRRKISRAPSCTHCYPSSRNRQAKLAGLDCVAERPAGGITPSACTFKVQTAGPKALPAEEQPRAAGNIQGAPRAPHNRFQGLDNGIMG